MAQVLQGYHCERRWSRHIRSSALPVSDCNFSDQPLWVEFATLIESTERPECSPTHPWDCYHRQIPNWVVFDHVIAALVHSTGYERLATPGCFPTTPSGAA